MSSGTLYLVATPIGNLEDITLRAVRVLREVDLIACEDTRHSRKLLTHLGIEKPLISYYEEVEGSRGEKLLERLLRGEHVALISDAGTPAISDPGYRLVRAALQEGVAVVPVPGPSALLGALVASGLPTDRFSFLGFLPFRSGPRRRLLQQWRTHEETLVIYEAPHRLLDCLTDLQAVMGSGRPIVVARELTKLHEEFTRGTLAEVRRAFATRELRGEFVLVLGGNAETDQAQAGEGAASAEDPLVAKTAAEPGARVLELLREGLEEKQALKQVARECGLSKSEVYRSWQLYKPRAKLPAAGGA